MIQCLKQHNILQHITAIEEKNRNSTLVMTDLNNINILDDIITESIITSEEKTQKSRFTYPWYP